MKTTAMVLIILFAFAVIGTVPYNPAQQPTCTFGAASSAYCINGVCHYNPTTYYNDCNNFKFNLIKFISIFRRK